jgi:hypothetical protein
VSRPGCQARGEVVCGTKPQEQQSLEVRPSGGPTHHGRSPAKARNGFPKPWWSWAQERKLGGQSSRDWKRRGPGPYEKNILVNNLGSKAARVK